MTTILSADRNTRPAVLAALREVHDGHWARNVGSDGGQTLEWRGRLIVIGAVTTAWDTAHAVIGVMGDRFVLVRIDSNVGRGKSGMGAIRNTGGETQMREELSAAVGGVLAHVCTDETKVSESEALQLVKAADIVTMSRTAVERDYRGDVTMAHAPEMPTRFAKQLAQMVRGGVALSMPRKRTMQLAIRCARDSIPPLRLGILLDLAANPGSIPNDVRQRINKPWATVKRELEALHMIGMVTCDEEEVEDEEGETKRKWLYSLDPGFDRATLLAMTGRNIATVADYFVEAARRNAKAGR